MYWCLFVLISKEPMHIPALLLAKFFGVSADNNRDKKKEYCRIYKGFRQNQTVQASRNGQT